MIKSKYNMNIVIEAKPKIWLISFADLLSLIVSFFIMSFAATKMPDKDWDKYADKIVNYVNGKGDKVLFSSLEFDRPNLFKKSKNDSRTNNINYTYTLLQNNLREVIPNPSQYKLTENKSSVILELVGSELLAKDDKNNFKLNLSKHGEEIIFSMSKIINPLSNQIEIGFTNSDEKLSLKVSDFISGKLNKSGYEYDILKLIPENFDPDEIAENTIVLIIRPYEIDI